MKNVVFAFYLISILLSLSCKKTKFPNEESKQIIGKWNFVSKVGTSAGSMGSEEYDLEFTSRSRFKYNHNGKKISATHYELVIRESIYGSDFNNQIRFSKADNYMSYKIKTDTMYLNDEFVNGARYVYVRE